ncbi:YwqG family protein [Streptomyces sp. NPDC037389]|uniref:YwqG family protein n=1 Tax=Streptomyces sp. NPDC037389 TaxID=3155369 RepID=UPI0033DE8A4E
MTESTLHDLARTLLPADLAERWISLLRPAARLVTTPEPGAEDVVVGRLGGLPELPEDMAWPVWEGRGPLSFIASVDCAALPKGALDIALPADGTLSFFYFDGQIDDGGALVWSEDPETWVGARVIHVPAGVAVAERDWPVVDDEDVEFEPYRAVPLTARVEWTAPDSWHPDFLSALRRDGDAGDQDHPSHPAEAEAFVEALWDLERAADHLIGGHANPVQGPVEDEIAHGYLRRDGADIPWSDPRIADEARRWTLLAQIDTDDAADMMWGDCGALYWLIRPEDLAAGRFDQAMFTMQCC